MSIFELITGKGSTRQVSYYFLTIQIVLSLKDENFNLISRVSLKTIISTTVKIDRKIEANATVRTNLLPFLADIF